MSCLTNGFGSYCSVRTFLMGNFTEILITRFNKKKKIDDTVVCESQTILMVIAIAVFWRYNIQVIWLNNSNNWVVRYIAKMRSLVINILLVAHQMLWCSSYNNFKMSEYFLNCYSLAFIILVAIDSRDWHIVMIYWIGAVIYYYYYNYYYYYYYHQKY